MSLRLFAVRTAIAFSSALVASIGNALSLFASRCTPDGYRVRRELSCSLQCCGTSVSAFAMVTTLPLMSPFRISGGSCISIH